MFFEQIATFTRDHHKEHMREYLNVVSGLYASKVPLILPKSYEVSSLVGGLAGVSRQTLPAYSVDAYTKALATDTDDLNTYVYGGHFLGLVGGENQNGIEKLVKRHGAAVEMFVREHRYFPHDEAPFMIVEFVFNRVEFFGAAAVEKDGKQFWIDGFRIDVGWRVSEQASDQHG